MGPAPVVQLPPGTPPPRVLVVDDIATNRGLLLRLLVPVGFAVREADNGIEAVEISEQWQPHAVLMDLQMPLLDGFSATRAIKAAAWGLQIAIIIISGDPGATVAADSLAAGAIAFVAKPFLEAEILAALASALRLKYVLTGPVS